MVFLRDMLPLTFSLFEYSELPEIDRSFEAAKFTILEGFVLAFEPSTNLSPSPLRRNCCRFLALNDNDFFVSSLQPTDVCG